MKKIAFDSMVLTYFLDANQQGYDPTTDLDRNLAPQRRAAFRLALYAEVFLLPTVERETRPIGDAFKRNEHLTWIWYHHLHEVLPEWLDQALVSRRTADLSAHHAGLNDCRLVAEAEAAGVNIIATNDPSLRTNLQSHTSIALMEPTECWTTLAIPKDSNPPWRPNRGHPHEHATWWWA